LRECSSKLRGLDLTLFFPTFCRLHCFNFLNVHTHNIHNSQQAFLRHFGPIFWLCLIICSNCQTSSTDSIIKSLLSEFIFKLWEPCFIWKKSFLFYFIFGIKTVIRFIVKLCKSDFFIFIIRCASEFDWVWCFSYGCFLVQHSLLITLQHLIFSRIASYILYVSTWWCLFAATFYL